MICVSLSPESNEEAVIKMQEAYKLVDIVELRIDGIRNVDLKRLLVGKRKKVIITNRCREEGGKFPGIESERIASLKQAVNLGAEYIDMELSTIPSLRNAIGKVIADSQGRTRLILSWHDMVETPSERALKMKLDQCRESGADIVKIVPFAAKNADNLKILNLIIHAKNRGQDIIAFCMGHRGRISRVLAPFLGSLISYVSITPAERTAPGQLTVAEMQQLMRILSDGHADNEHDLCTLR
jgi:3-dehydroquinate dehydratase type I